MCHLIALSGLPGVGKSTIAKALAPRIGAPHLRVDTLEAALKTSMLKIHPAQDAGYLALAGIARDNLALGLDVIADTVNPIDLTRTLWADTAASAGARLVNIEVVCSDPAQHRSQVETRISDIDGLSLPDWATVCAREFAPWAEDRLIIDTAHLSVDQAVAAIIAHLNQLRSA